MAEVYDVDAHGSLDDAVEANVATGGISFPDGALGRQHACHRGVLCEPCSRKPSAERQKNGN